MTNDYRFEKNKIKAYLGDSLYDALKLYNCIIAGGMITSLFCNRGINDVDVYFRSYEDLGDFIREQVAGNSDMWIIAKTEKALLFKNDDIEVQLICFSTFDNVQDLFNTFDFTVCMAAYDFKTEEFVFTDNYFKHNSQRLLVFNDKTAFPICSALRVEKYKDKGYTISKNEYLRIILTCMNMKIDNYEDLKEQIGGMYGVDYDDVIKPLENEEFDLKTVVYKMQEVIYHPDYFKKKETTPFTVDDWDLLIYELTKEPLSVYKVNNKIYINSCVDGFTSVEDDYLKKFNNVEYKDIKDILFRDGMFLYKSVKKDSDVFRSYYRNSFKYEIGEWAISDYDKTKNTNWNNGGIYCTTLEDIESNFYFGNKDMAILKLEVKEEDIIDISDKTIRVMKAKPVKVVEYNRDSSSEI